MTTINGVRVFDYHSRRAAADATPNPLVGHLLRQTDAALVLDRELRPVPNPSAWALQASPGGWPRAARGPLRGLLGTAHALVLVHWMDDAVSNEPPVRLYHGNIDLRPVTFGGRWHMGPPIHPNFARPQVLAGKQAIWETGTYEGKETPPLLHISCWDLPRLGLLYVPPYPTPVYTEPKAPKEYRPMEHVVLANGTQVRISSVDALGPDRDPRVDKFVVGRPATVLANLCFDGLEWGPWVAGMALGANDRALGKHILHKVVLNDNDGGNEYWCAVPELEVEKP